LDQKQEVQGDDSDLEKDFLVTFFVTIHFRIDLPMRRSC
jgi:hypothetical protein